VVGCDEFFGGRRKRILLIDWEILSEERAFFLRTVIFGWIFWMDRQ
jgi:hypothetical protein